MTEIPTLPVRARRHRRIRMFLTLLICLGCLSAVRAQEPSHDKKPTDKTHVTAEEALKRLAEGNQRFITGKLRHPHQSRDWRSALEAGQDPYAVILGCADSRVPPELLFDQGFGDLFVIRVAGNVVDTDVAGTIEYAIDHLNSHVIVVMGHTFCGAVTAALDQSESSMLEPDEIVSLLYRIEPAFEDLPDDLPREKRLDMAVRLNVQLGVRRLSQVPDLMKSLKSGKVVIVGAVYDLHTGKVEFVRDDVEKSR